MDGYSYNDDSFSYGNPSSWQILIWFGLTIIVIAVTFITTNLWDLFFKRIFNYCARYKNQPRVKGGQIAFCKKRRNLKQSTQVAASCLKKPSHLFFNDDDDTTSTSRYPEIKAGKKAKFFLDAVGQLELPTGHACGKGQLEQSTGDLGETELISKGQAEYGRCEVVACVPVELDSSEDQSVTGLLTVVEQNSDKQNALNSTDVFGTNRIVTADFTNLRGDVLDEKDNKKMNQIDDIKGDKELEKYWAQRYRLFSKFDSGIRIDRGKSLLKLCEKKYAKHTKAYNTLTDFVI